MVTEQLWAGWWRWYLLSVADQSPTIRTVFFPMSAATRVLLSGVAASDLATNVDSM